MKTGYNTIILQSVESDKDMLDKEWKSLNWDYIEYSIFKIQNGYLKQRKQMTIEKSKDYVDYLSMTRGVYYTVFTL